MRASASAADSQVDVRNVSFFGGKSGGNQNGRMECIVENEVPSARRVARMECIMENKVPWVREDARMECIMENEVPSARRDARMECIMEKKVPLVGE